jgi:hypothetical protein
MNMTYRASLWSAPDGTNQLHVGCANSLLLVPSVRDATFRHRPPIPGTNKVTDAHHRCHRAREVEDLEFIRADSVLRS